jgi:hypothetical protein
MMQETSQYVDNQVVKVKKVTIKQKVINPEYIDDAYKSRHVQVEQPKIKMENNQVKSEPVS